MVNEFTSPCLVYEPGSAPTAPPKPFKAEGEIIVTPVRPGDSTFGHGGDHGGDLFIDFPIDLFDPASITNLDVLGNVTNFDLERNFFRHPNATPSEEYRDTRYQNTLFGNQVHKDIINAINSNVRSYYVNSLFFYTTYYNSNLPILNSLNEKLRRELDKLPIKDVSRVVEAISSSVLLDELERIDNQDLLKIIKEAPAKQERISITEAYSIFNDNKVPLNPEKHDNLFRQKELQTWKTFPLDLDKKLEITASGTSYYSYVAKDDSITFIDASGNEDLLYINDGDTLSVVAGRGILEHYPLTTTIDQAYTLPQDVINDLFNSLGAEEFKLHAKFIGTSSVDTEAQQDLESESATHFFYKLEPSSVTDLPTGDVGIRYTSSVYTKLSELEDINDYIKFKGFPTMVLPVANHDPLVALMIRENTLNISSMDLDFRGMRGDFMPRTIPYYIIVTPTDSIKLNNFNVKSTLTDITNDIPVRELSFVFNQYPQNKNKGLSHDYLTRNFSYPSTNINYNLDTQGIYYSFGIKDRLNKIRFRGGSETLPKDSLGLRKFLSITQDLVDNYTIEDNTLTWFDVLSRMKLCEVFYVLNYLSRKAHENLRAGQLTNTTFTTSTRNKSTGLGTLTGSEVGGVISNPNNVRTLFQ